LSFLSSPFRNNGGSPGRRRAAVTRRRQRSVCGVGGGRRAGQADRPADRVAGDQGSGTRGHGLRSRLLARGVRQRLGAHAVLFLLVRGPRPLARRRPDQAPARSAGRGCRREGPDHRQRCRATVLGVLPGHPPRRMAQPGRSAADARGREMMASAPVFADCLLCPVLDYQADVAVD